MLFSKFEKGAYIWPMRRVEENRYYLRNDLVLLAPAANVLT
jgi:hypothetical protein